MKYSNSKIKNLYEKKNLQLIKYCEWKDCNNKGIYRAPKNRNNLREFRWFCLNHVREYNKKYDFVLKGDTRFQDPENYIRALDPKTFSSNRFKYWKSVTQ